MRETTPTLPYQTQCRWCVDITGAGAARAQRHVLDTKTFEFSKIETTGTIPDPRSNHCMVHVKDSLFLYGGRSFDNAYALHRVPFLWRRHSRWPVDLTARCGGHADMMTCTSWTSRR